VGSKKKLVLCSVAIVFCYLTASPLTFQPLPSETETTAQRTEERDSERQKKGSFSFWLGKHHNERKKGEGAVFLLVL